MTHQASQLIDGKNQLYIMKALKSWYGVRCGVSQSVPVSRLRLSVQPQGHHMAQSVRGRTGGVGVDHVGQGDGHLLVAVVEQLGDDQPVQQVPGLDHLARP